MEVLIKLGLKSVEGMAFDHISKILYIVDGAKKTIELVKGRFVFQHVLKQRCRYLLFLIQADHQYMNYFGLF